MMRHGEGVDYHGEVRACLALPALIKAREFAKS